MLNSLNKRFLTGWDGTLLANTLHMETTLIPENKVGKENDLSEERDCESAGNACEIFENACKKLLNPDGWHRVSGKEITRFKLADEKGEFPQRELREGDYIRIDIAGPGPAAGDGYDWVRVVKVEDKRDKNADSEFLGIQLRASSPPDSDKTETAHFFTGQASSSMIVMRNGQKVTASYHGRNEVVNNKTEKIADNIRNTIVGGTARLGLSELQWKALIKNLVTTDK